MKKTTKVDPHAIARRIIGDPIRFAIDGSWETRHGLKATNELCAAIRQQGDWSPEAQRDTLLETIKSALPDNLQEDLDRLMELEQEREAITEEASFLLGVYLGRGCACR